MDIISIIGYIIGAFFCFLAIIIFIGAFIDDLIKIRNIKLNNTKSEIKKIILSIFKRIQEYVLHPTLIIRKILNIFYSLKKYIMINFKELCLYLLNNITKILIVIFFTCYIYKTISLSEEIYYQIHSLTAIFEELGLNSELNIMEKLKSGFSVFSSQLNFLFWSAMIGYLVLYIKNKEYKEQVEELLKTKIDKSENFEK